MTTKQQDKRQTDKDNQENQQFGDGIGKQVMQTLGQPVGPHRVQVRRLWGNHYRVNVFVDLDASTTKVAHSYFLTIDSQGNILSSNPDVTKQY